MRRQKRAAPREEKMVKFERIRKDSVFAPYVVMVVATARETDNGLHHEVKAPDHGDRQPKHVGK